MSKTLWKDKLLLVVKEIIVDSLLAAVSYLIGRQMERSIIV